MTDWNIQSRARTCTACAKSFADRETYHTLLTQEKAELRRADLCQGCWEKSQGDVVPAREGFVSSWMGVYEAPPPPSEVIQKETAETLLRKLIALNDPRYVPAGFILAVMLERKRLLKVKQQLVQEGRRVFIYEQPGSGDLFTIVDPNLQLNQLETVQRDVATLLEHGLTPPPEPTAPEAPAAAAPAREEPAEPAAEPVAAA